MVSVRLTGDVAVNEAAKGEALLLAAAEAAVAADVAADAEVWAKSIVGIAVVDEPVVPSGMSSR